VYTTTPYQQEDHQRLKKKEIELVGSFFFTLMVTSCKPNVARKGLIGEEHCRDHQKVINHESFTA
jgi:hypothetical protein